VTQNKHVESDIKDIPRLEKHISDLKTKKQKVEAILPKLEEQINSLGQETELKQEVVREVEQEINSLNQELGIKEEIKQEAPADGSKQEILSQEPPVAGSPSENNLVSDNAPQDGSNPNSQTANKQNTNLQEFQTLRSQTQELIEELEKIIKRDEEAINN